MISDLSVDSVSQNSAASVSPPESPAYFCVPTADLETFSRLPDAVRNETATTLLLLRRIHGSQSKSREARVIAFERRGQRGYSAESLLRKYYRYIDTGDWRDVLDRAKAGPTHWNADSVTGLPKDFIEFWKALCERNQRKNAPARRSLIRIWQTGRDLQGNDYKKIPGYPQWNPSQRTTLNSQIPQGWSLANLQRHAPSKMELAVARQGREAGAKFRRKVFTTRAGLAVGQFILFDDQEYDLRVNWPGARGSMRPLGLNALDLYSACCISVGFKPTLTDEEGTKKKLRERDMLWLVADVLCHKGFRADERGTTLIVEHGTAAIRRDFEERILAATAGKVTVDRSGLSSVHMPGLFEGQSKGNPRFKAALESLFNLVRNEMAALPGQTGMDRQHAPTQLHGQDKYNTQLLKLARLLPPHRAALLRFPFLTWEQFLEVTLDVYHQINNRTEHELEGWEKCGHVVQDFFLDFGNVCPDRVGPPSAQDASAASGQWLSQSQWLAMEPQKRRALEPFVQAQCRKLSPQEVWNRDAGQLQKLGDHALPILLGPEFAIERAVRGGYITIEDRELDSEPIRFPAGANCRDGEKFLVYHSPLHADRLILTDSKGRYVGTLERQIVPCRADAQGVIRELGAARREESQRLAGVVTRAMPVAAANRDMHRNNLEVVNGQPISPEEKSQAAEVRSILDKYKRKERPVEELPPADPTIQSPINELL